MKHSDQNLNQIFFFMLWFCGIQLLVDDVRALVHCEWSILAVVKRFTVCFMITA